MGYAPSTFGYFYLLSGIEALAIGMVILVIGVMVVWSLILSLSLRVRPVLMAIFLSWFFITLVDGNWDGLIFRLFTLFVVIAFCELLSRVRFGEHLKR